MKKIVFSVTAFFAAWIGTAQNINDVVSYHTNNSAGTARFQALSGAFGALGGDLSAIGVNPAGSAIFAFSNVGFSLSTYNIDNSTRYFNGTNNNSLGNLQINQVGGVMVFNNTDVDSDWKKFTLAFNYDMVNNYKNRFYAFGNSTESVDQFFVNNANGYVLDEVSALPGESISDAYFNIGSDPALGYPALQGFLGYESFIIDPETDDPNNTSYVSSLSYGNTVSQEYRVSTGGYDHRFTANMATQYGENLYLGINLDFQSIDRDKTTIIEEYGYDAGSAVEYVYFENYLRTYGTAFSFNVGGIAKLNDVVRIGASYQSPTWYRLTDELQQYIETDQAVIDPRVIFVFPDYKIQIPAKLTGSLALVFPNGLLSFDYGYQDMSKAELKPASDAYFAAENQFISDNLKAVSTYKIGGEYKIERLSLRGGYRFEESPYENETTVGDLTGYSLGLGYNFGPTRVDLAYSQAQRDYNKPVLDGGIPTTVAIDREDTLVTLSLNFSF